MSESSSKIIYLDIIYFCNFIIINLKFETPRYFLKNLPKIFHFFFKFHNFSNHPLKFPLYIPLYSPFPTLFFQRIRKEEFRRLFQIR